MNIITHNSNNNIIINDDDNNKECVCLSKLLDNNVVYCKLLCGCEVLTL